MGLFGIGDGKMDIALDGQSFGEGAKITGTATLTLNKDVNAKGVFAMLLAQKEEMYYMNGSPSRRWVPVYNNTVVLDKERLYAKASSPFSYKLSLDVPKVGAMNSQMTGNSTVNMLANLASGGIAAPLQWFVVVELKHEGMLSFPIEKKQQINVVSGSSQQAMQ